jgi:ribonuclease HI
VKVIRRLWQLCKGRAGQGREGVQGVSRLTSGLRLKPAFFVPRHLDFEAYRYMAAKMEHVNGFTSVNGTAPSPPAVPTIEDPPATAGVKRKRESKNAVKFYSVRIGKEPGIYHTWQECLEQVRGFPKAAFKSFSTLTEAEAFLNNEQSSGGGSGGNTGKFYGVQSGRKPGVYNSWPEVLEQITGWKGPKHKVFKTRMEAELFVAEGQQNLSNGDSAIHSIEFDDIGTPASKKQKTGKSKKTAIKEEGSPILNGEGGEYEPGEGPLPDGAEDNFDSTITLDGITGHARYKTAAELAQTKYQASGPAKDAPIRIYTDGSSLHNGQAAAIAGVGVYFGPLDKRNISEPLTGTKQTNQRAELTAILRALEVAPRDRKIVLITDSKYAIQCCTEWFLNWRRNNWLNASNKPVENKDLVMKIIDMLEERFRLNKHRMSDDDDDVEPGAQHWERGPASVKFVWVKGHAKDEGNNAADALAVNGAKVAKEMGTDLGID